eukprot:721950-Pelagomonas_calceolata.AAC.3
MIGIPLKTRLARVLMPNTGKKVTNCSISNEDGSQLPLVASTFVLLVPIVIAFVPPEHQVNWVGSGVSTIPPNASHQLRALRMCQAAIGGTITAKGSQSLTEA